MNQIRRVLQEILSSVIGLVIFLVLLLILNYLGIYINNGILNFMIYFLNSNFYIFILIMIVGLFGEIFSKLVFPFNLASPIFKATLGIFIVYLLIGVWNLLEEILGINLVFENLGNIVYTLVFIIVLVASYIRIFASMGKKEDKKEVEADKKIKDRKSKRKK